MTNSTMFSNNWLSRAFFESAVVLGIDIGLQGIGVCLRKGPNVIYLKSLEFDLPESATLASRRQKRAWRHCRKNRKTRISRLRKLFIKHGIPWPDEATLSHTDPFLLRYRAVSSSLASRHALGIAIRHCLLRRGYDFHANSEGDFPWGDSASIQSAIAWMKNSHITAAMKPEMEDLLKFLHGSKKRDSEDPDKDWAEERSQFLETLDERVIESEANGIKEHLARYKSDNGSKDRSRMREHNFHRSAVEGHIRTIIERHRHLIDDPDGFTEALFLKPKADDVPSLQRRAREKAIFHFQRKTRHEMAELWEKKRRDCRLAAAFDLPVEKAGLASDIDIRKWRTLEFLIYRRIEISVTTGKGKGKATSQTSVRASAALVERLVASIQPHKALSVKEVRACVAEDIKAKHQGGKPLPDSKSSSNKDYFAQLRDLLVPTVANQRKTATVCSGTARYLFDLATNGGVCFDHDAVDSRLQGIDFFQKRKSVDTGGMQYPQVRFLLGERAKKGSKKGQRAVEGILQKIFKDPEYAEALRGASVPEYLIIECVRDMPATVEQRLRIKSEQEKRRKERDKIQLKDTGVTSRRRRLAYHAQQRGRCPFTGLDLPDALDPNLELEHLYPDSRGGLSMDSNLVLTFRTVNALKGNLTPMEFADEKGGTTTPDGKRVLAWKEMLENVEDFKWGRAKKSAEAVSGTVLNKRDIFAFDASDGEFPEFGNTTRTAQLARQLVNEACHWMGIAGDAEEQRKRIGTPSGWLTAQARRAWALDQNGEPLRKDRDQPQHHLVDAYVISHIPPAEGMNHVRCGGIFQSSRITRIRNGVVSHKPVTAPIAGLCPNFGADVLPLLGHDPEVLPIYKHRPRKWASQLGDETFWRVDPSDGKTYQRKPLLRKDFSGAEAVLKALTGTRIPVDKLPSKHAVQRWLDRSEDDPACLKLADGTPIRSIWKCGSKGSLASPLGWSGFLNGSEVQMAFFSLDEKSEALEFWLGWNGRKWAFLKRRRPAPVAMRHLRRFTKSWNEGPAPAWMQAHPDKPETHKTLEEIVCGNPVPSVGVKLAELKRGQTFRIEIKPDSRIGPGGKGRSTWWEVTAIMRERPELKPCLALPEDWISPQVIKKSEPAQWLAVLRPDLDLSDLSKLSESLGLSVSK